MNPPVSMILVPAGTLTLFPTALIFCPTIRMVPFSMTSVGVTSVPFNAYVSSCALLVHDEITRISSMAATVFCQPLIGQPPMQNGLRPPGKITAQVFLESHVLRWDNRFVVDVGAV